jgi:hypothetical protein
MICRASTAFLSSRGTQRSQPLAGHPVQRGFSRLPLAGGDDPKSDACRTAATTTPTNIPAEGAGVAVDLGQHGPPQSADTDGAANL